ncbi:MAG: ornithine cyclodeaminase [Muribaculum sp.]|nr:ornithine cyclodeaminase [Muribaculaceae bacterium]MCM1081588.1 ornithine cyclodeaminase [Muribaculum sp.]
MFKHITTQQIGNLNLSWNECIQWVHDDFLFKAESQLPAKVSVHPQGRDFITTMPCLLPQHIGRFGVKIVSRISGNHPPLKSDILLYDSASGQLLALVDADRITTLRTAAVATLAIESLQRNSASVYAFVGLGNTGLATLDCLISRIGNNHSIEIRLKQYKDHAEKTAAAMSARYPQVKFSTFATMESMVEGADVVVSCITDAESMMIDSPERFAPGALLVPVHTRGFQNCDTVFDQIVADDTAHVSSFRYFNEFRRFCEFSDVLSGKVTARTSDADRIIAYNIGLGLHDVYFASQIYNLLNN